MILFYVFRARFLKGCGLAAFIDAKHDGDAFRLAAVGIAVLVYAVLLSIGDSISATGNIDSWLAIFAKASVFSLLVSAAIVMALAAFRHFHSQCHECRTFVDSIIEFLSVGKRRFFVLFLFWLPGMMLLYPGVFTFDTSFQLCQFFGNPTPGYFPMDDGAAFSDHHPIATTIYIGIFVWVGELIGSCSSGFFLLCLVQGFAYAATIAFLLAQFENQGVSRRAIFAALLFFALNPIMVFVVMMPCKDTIFGWIFIWFLGLFTKLCYGGITTLGDRKFFLSLVCSCVLLSLSKKTGAYFVLILGLILLLAYRKYLIRLLSLTFSGLFVVSILLPCLIFPIFDVSTGSKIEMLGPLYQQTARYAFYHPDDVTDDEEVAIDEMLGYDSLSSRYNFHTVDTVHHSYDVVNTSPSMDQIARYAQAYIAQGMRHPLCYFLATAAEEAGWFNPNERIVVAQGYMQLSPENGKPEITVSPQSWERGAQVTSFANWVTGLPLLDFLFCPTVYVGLIPTLSFSIMTLGKRASLKTAVIILLPWLCSIPFLLLSPVSTTSTNIEAFRYLLPFILMSPYLLLVASSRSETQV